MLTVEHNVVCNLALYMQKKKKKNSMNASFRPKHLTPEYQQTQKPNMSMSLVKFSEAKHHHLWTEPQT